MFIKKSVVTSLPLYATVVGAALIAGCSTTERTDTTPPSSADSSTSSVVQSSGTQSLAQDPQKFAPVQLSAATRFSVQGSVDTSAQCSLISLGADKGSASHLALATGQCGKVGDRIVTPDSSVPQGADASAPVYVGDVASVGERWTFISLISSMTPSDPKSSLPVAVSTGILADGDRVVLMPHISPDEQMSPPLMADVAVSPDGMVSLGVGGVVPAPGVAVVSKDATTLYGIARPGDTEGAPPVFVSMTEITSKSAGKPGGAFAPMRW